MQEPKITPLARRLAEENGIDWRQLKGSGPEGTIVERDVLAFLAKIMAGEVDLPPIPEPPRPAPAAPDPEALRRAQEVLGREGVELGEVLPSAQAPAPAPELREEDLSLDDLLLDLEEPAPNPPPPTPTETREDLGLEEDWQDLLQEEPQAPPPEATPPQPPLPEEDWPLPEAAPTPPPPVPSPPPPAPAPAFRSLRVLRHPLDLGPLEAAQAAYARLGFPKTPLPFLYRAAEKALGELEIPLRPLLGQVEGEEVRGLRPRGGFSALFRLEGEEAGEGLLCLAGEAEVHTGRPSLFLLPEGLLALSGLEERLGRAFLERVALYLENPVLLIG